MAAVAGIGCCGIISVVASGAITGDSSMRPVQSIIIVVNRERRRFPTRSRGMTHSTVRREVQRYVVGVDRLVEICGMTTTASIWCIGVIAVVTSIAVVRN